MKTKSILFSNFNYNYTNKNENINNLIIDKMSNVNTNNGFIESELSVCDFLNEIFNEEILNTIQNLNIEILLKIKKFTIYEYFNETSFTKETRLLAISSDNILFELNFETYIFEEKYAFLAECKEILFNNILYYFDSENKCVVIENNNILTVENIPKIHSYIYFENKLYFSVTRIPNKLFISDSINLKNISTNLEQFTSINIPIEDGMICKIVTIKNQIYIVTQYSIFKLDTSENIIQRQNCITSNIFIDSVIQYDDTVLFYSENGLFSFDGTDIKQLFNNFINIHKNAFFVIFNQKIYILSKDFENVIFIYNFNLNQISFIKVNNIKNIYQINSYSHHLFCLCYEDGNLLNTISLYSQNFNSINFSQSITFKPIFLSSNSLKQIQSLSINSTGEFQLKIYSDISNSIFNISNNSRLTNLTINGNYFIFEISSNSKFKLNSILLTYSEIGE